MAAPGTRHWPDGSDFLDVALSAVGNEERAGHIERLETFVEEHRDRLEELLRAYGRAAGLPRTAGTRWSVSPRPWSS